MLEQTFYKVSLTKLIFLSVKLARTSGSHLLKELRKLLQCVLVRRVHSYKMRSMKQYSQQGTQSKIKETKAIIF